MIEKGDIDGKGIFSIMLLNSMKGILRGSKLYSHWMLQIVLPKMKAKSATSIPRNRSTVNAREKVE